MQTAAEVVVGILALVSVGGVWMLIPKITNLLTGSARGTPREEWLGVGIGVVVRAVVTGVAAAIAFFAGV